MKATESLREKGSGGEGEWDIRVSNQKMADVYTGLKKIIKWESKSIADGWFLNIRGMLFLLVWVAVSVRWQLLVFYLLF